jgi:hypothetical protein
MLTLDLLTMVYLELNQTFINLENAKKSLMMCLNKIQRKESFERKN